MISGNSWEVHIPGGASSNVVKGNTIGLDATGTFTLADGYYGVFLGSGSSNNVIGGTIASDRNVISGSLYPGVEVNDMGSGNRIQGNYIGTDKTGFAALGLATGVRLEGSNALVGGVAAAERNIISGNDVGVLIEYGSNNHVQGNYIGVAPDGMTALGNGSGVIIDYGAVDNLIGGETAGAGNLIAHNESDGVLIAEDFCIGNSVLGNRIYANGGQAIDLARRPHRQ